MSVNFVIVRDFISKAVRSCAPASRTDIRGIEGVQSSVASMMQRTVAVGCDCHRQRNMIQQGSGVVTVSIMTKIVARRTREWGQERMA
jgi:hypothetical protein